MSVSYQLRPTDQRKLIEGAFFGKEQAYSPYSHFPVGAAVLCAPSTERIFTGGSIDNACWAETICAERVAIVKAVSEGYRNFKGLSVVSNAKSYITPCGLCRQVMAEFCSPEMPVILIPGDPAEEVTVKSFGRLFPLTLPSGEFP
ncbi:cytidine deaminase [Marasmius fiardii PR-910]|nr:cytidine deaminase [Marasmius fiardii PR-910]